MPETPQTTDRLDTLIDDLADELKELVTEIETGSETTQNHYGHYMSVIIGASAGNKAKGQIVAVALIKAGANKAGVKSALSLSF